MNFSFSQSVEELNNNNKSLTYSEVIAEYKKLDAQYDACRLVETGMTDAGIPLHTFLISANKNFDPVALKKSGKAVLFINNGIHPGEPDGMDACVRLSQNILSGKLPLPGNLVICIIPVYNIDGALNRGCCSRANQNGPEMYGFRGNGQNLDLNRDFIKCDSQNAKSFTEIFHRWNPDVFVDTHVSNGADYQHNMTLISTQHNKLGGPAGTFLKNVMTPALFKMMKERGNEMTPYVNTLKYNDDPETGIYAFNEPPRFASGYAALFGTFSFVTETHMLKPFAKRVESTILFLENIINFSNSHANEIISVRKRQEEIIRFMEEFPLSWEVDSSKFELIPFNGYETGFRTSKVTGLQQRFYDTAKPFTREIKFYDQYKPVVTITRPDFYFIPQAWRQVIRRLQQNKVEMQQFPADTVLKTTTYVIEDYKTTKEPYEGHYLHSQVKLKTETKEQMFLKGDYIIRVNQPANRYIVETLEPQAPDSWFAWGFFDSILQQKEYFSDYVFDDLALKLLEENPGLRERFEKKKAVDAGFAGNGYEQLNFIYMDSEYFEDYRRYPVSRYNGVLKL